MRQDIPNSPNRGSITFQQIADAFLAQDGLPFSDVLPGEQIERAFARKDGLFAQHGVYSTTIVLWAFLSQVLRDGKEASCQSAVARITSHCLHEGIQPPTHDTGDYCKARAKLSEAALHELGKETGETALLRSMLSSLHVGDIAVFDRCYCSFLMIALLQLQGTDVCARLHQKRPSDFRTGKRLGKGDHLIVWSKPARPDGMDQETYDRIPETLELREMRFAVVEKGRRTKTITVVTTLTDAELYSDEEIAELYGFRWNSELDIRAIKSSLHLAHVRCKSPAMVRRELRTTLLAYNLIRTTAANAASLHGRQPRQISFTGTCQYVLSSWQLISCGALTTDQRRKHVLGLLGQIAACEVANRPGRLEPRVLKRRRHGYPLMQKPRTVLRRELQKYCT
jgi:hypothetical protein